jgi:hypothetical protein
MTSGAGPEGEELLGPTRPLLPRRLRQAGTVLLALCAAAGIGVAVWPGDHHPQPGGGPAHHPQPPPTAVRERAWPSARESCGGSAELPLVTGARRTGARPAISVLVGGTRLARLAFATGRIRWFPRAGVHPDEYVNTVAGDYAVAINCAGPDVGSPRLLRIDGDGVVPVTLRQHVDDWLLDGRRAWGLRWSTDPGGHDTLFPTNAGPAVALPVHFAPVGITDGVVVGNMAAAIGAGPVVLVDATTGKVRKQLAAGQVLGIGHGELVWATGCAVGTGQSCTAHRRAVDGGPTTDYRLPRSPSFTLGALSPDGTNLAFPIARSLPDPRFRVDHPFPPADVAVLHLDTGRYDIVPGVELPPKSAPALSFTPSGWLVIGLDAGTRTRLLAWRPGMAHPLEARPLPGLAGSPPGLWVLSGGER